MKKHSKLFKVWLALAAVTAIAGVIVTQAGCMTPAQRAALTRALNAADEAEKKVAEYEGEIAAVKKMREEKKIDPAVAVKILAKLNADKDELKAVYTENKAAAKAMKDAESPWWAYLIYGLNVVNAVGGSALGYGKVAGVLKAFGTLSRGTEDIITALGEKPGGKELTPELAKKLLAAGAGHDGTGPTLKVLHHDSLAGTI